MTTTPSAQESAPRRADQTAAEQSGPRQRPDGGGAGGAEQTEVDVQRAPARSAAPSAEPTAQPVVRQQTPDDDDEDNRFRRLFGYRRQRFEARKVRRLIRHIDPWSMLKLSLLLAMCMWLIVMIAAVVLWTVARNAGTVESVESFVNSSLSLQDWALDGDFLFRQFGLITLLLALGFATATVVASLLFNLVSDIIGGVWISVIEEESARPLKDSNRP